ncbi:MAG: PCMD domain-containing protein [Bacteroidales bacterium]|nr:PCMD domain-containing protein [Bacteroidales bacterium]
MNTFRLIQKSILLLLGSLLSLVLDKDTGGYIPFTIDLKYVSDKEPGYLFIAVLASRLGEYFTGSSKSVIYVDEFTFNY